MEEDSCVLVPTNWGVGVQARVGPHGITALLLRCTRTGADLFHLSRTATCSCPLRLVFVREDDGVIKLHIECSITILTPYTTGAGAGSGGLLYVGFTMRALRRRDKWDGSIIPAY